MTNSFFPYTVSEASGDERGIFVSIGVRFLPSGDRTVNEELSS